MQNALLHFRATRAISPRLLPLRPRRALTVIFGGAALLLSACGKRAIETTKNPATDSTSAQAEQRASVPVDTTGSDTGRSGAHDTPPASGALATELTLTPQQVQHAGVRWAQVTMGTVATRAIVPGEVIPDENRTARLGAPGRGRIVGVSVQPGERVSSGQVLVALQSPEAGAAQSDLTKATAGVTASKAQEQYADAARARAERLLALRAIPRQDYDRAVADDEQAHAALAQAESELARARSAANQLGAGAASPAGEFLIRSTIRGVVLERTAGLGAVVDAGTPLVVITDPSTLWLSINAPEQFASLFRFGQRVRFTVPAYPADTFAARIDAVGAGLDSSTRTLVVRGAIANGGQRLKPEMLASVVVDGGASVTAALVPEDAVQLLDGKPNVFIAVPDNKGSVHIERRVVEVGSRSGGRIGITRGLARGDVIVVAGAFSVKAEFEKATMPKDEG